MQSIDRIRVMISSRCSDKISYQGKDAEYSVVRKAIKNELESVKLCGHNIYDCWINEDAGPAPGTDDAWSHCLSQVKNADIVIVLYNGNAGWIKHVGGIGICHDEFQTGLSSGAARVMVIKMPDTTVRSKENTLFQEYVTSQSRFHASALTGEEVITAVINAVVDSTVALSRLGVRESRKGKYDTGKALEWSRLSFRERKQEIEKILLNGLEQRSGSSSVDNHVVINIENTKVLCVCHGIPSAFGVAAAREMVGQPFLLDYQLNNELGNRIYGPVHIIGCHQLVTENQAMNFLGFPDAILVKTSFGVYVADRIQKIQVAFLTDCRDETTTKHSLSRLMEWLEQSGESTDLAERAKSRKKIVNAIANEVV